jgi:hypothetical protein
MEFHSIEEGRRDVSKQEGVQAWKSFKSLGELRETFMTEQTEKRRRWPQPRIGSQKCGGGEGQLFLVKNFNLIQQQPKPLKVG